MVVVSVYRAADVFKKYRERLAPGANCAFYFGILSAVLVGVWLFLLIVAVRRVGMGAEPCKTVLTIVMLVGLEAALIYLVLRAGRALQASRMVVLRAIRWRQNVPSDLVARLAPLILAVGGALLIGQILPPLTAADTDKSAILLFSLLVVVIGSMVGATHASVYRPHFRTISVVGIVAAIVVAILAVWALVEAGRAPNSAMLIVTLLATLALAALCGVGVLQSSPEKRVARFASTTAHVLGIAFPAIWFFYLLHESLSASVAFYTRAETILYKVLLALGTVGIPTATTWLLAGGVSATLRTWRTPSYEEVAEYQCESEEEALMEQAGYLPPVTPHRPMPRTPAATRQPHPQRTTHRRRSIDDLTPAERDALKAELRHLEKLRKAGWLSARKLERKKRELFARYGLPYDQQH
ncbi:MAG: hypothetical protein DRP63_08345 [Planctomycetota bacterium]|nr:MAG: hypothetical protein DRP63_08345 [Planctomycetota bacterium]